MTGDGCPDNTVIPVFFYKASDHTLFKKDFHTKLGMVKQIIVIAVEGFQLLKSSDVMKQCNEKRQFMIFPGNVLLPADKVRRVQDTERMDFLQQDLVIASVVVAEILPETLFCIFQINHILISAVLVGHKVCKKTHSGKV